MTGSPLRVTLDVSAVPARPGGAGRYTVALARALGARPDVEPVLVARRADARWDTLVPGPEVARLAPSGRPSRLAWEQLRMAAALRRLAPAVHHGPHYTMPARSPVPVVVTVHDCTFFDHPEWHQRTKAPFFRRAIRAAAARAAVVVCGSRTTADRLHQVCEVRAPVVVAPYGVDAVQFAETEPEPGDDRRSLHRLGLDPDRPAVVFLGTIEPRKGVAGLVRAFDRVAAGAPDLLLVLAGQDGWGTAELGRALAAARHRDRVVRVGYVPEGAAAALLRTAAVVAYPSIEEGGGLPALEALACGAPVVTTEGTAMAEMAEGAAVLVPPGDDDALADALAAVLAGDPAAAERQVRGLAVARARTWEAAAGLHVDAYRRAAGGGGG